MSPLQVQLVGETVFGFAFWFVAFTIIVALTRVVVRLVTKKPVAGRILPRSLAMAGVLQTLLTIYSYLEMTRQLPQWLR